MRAVNKQTDEEHQWQNDEKHHIAPFGRDEDVISRKTSRDFSTGSIDTAKRVILTRHAGRLGGWHAWFSPINRPVP
jgi:hypothetical protein